MLIDKLVHQLTVKAPSVSEPLAHDYISFPLSRMYSSSINDTIWTLLSIENLQIMLDIFVTKKNLILKKFTRGYFTAIDNI